MRASRRLGGLLSWLIAPKRSSCRHSKQTTIFGCSPALLLLLRPGSLTRAQCAGRWPLQTQFAHIAQPRASQWVALHPVAGHVHKGAAGVALQRAQRAEGVSVGEREPRGMGVACGKAKGHGWSTGALSPACKRK